MTALLSGKIRIVRAEEIARHEHVGFSTVFGPVLERLDRRVSDVLRSIVAYLYPVYRWLLWQATHLLHLVMAAIGKKFLSLADTIKGKNSLRKRGSAPLFLQDMIEHQRAVRGEN